VSGIIFSLFISIGLTLVAFFYAIITKRYIPFLLVMFAFIGSQVLIRIPIRIHVGSQHDLFNG